MCWEKLSAQIIADSMKTTLTIFVSGSKSLKEHRLRLKALVNNINGESRLKGIPIFLNMFSYVNLGDNQADYNDFIQHKSDIAIFLVEGRMGEKTREEFLLSVEGLKKTGTPRIYFFLKEFKEKTPEIEEVERLISDNLSSYYIEYSSLEDLENKVKERLNNEVSELMEKEMGTSKRKVRFLKFWSWAATIACLFLMLLVGGMALAGSDDVTLLFVGGGSAVNCLEEYEGIGNVYKYDRSICLAVPTSTAWPIVANDVRNHQAQKGGKNDKLFFPISLSAMTAQEQDFLRMTNKPQFIAKGSVLSYHLGEDCLTTYVKKTYKNAIIDGKDTISVKELAAFLRDVAKKQDLNIFTTDQGSGTLTYYQKSLTPYGMTISKESLGEQVDRFTDLSPKSKIRRDETPYVMLGSRYYVAKEVYEEGDCRPICIKDENGQMISKSIFLYFAGYNVDDGANYWIPNEMVEFLLKMDPRFSSVIHNNRIPRHNERVIVSLNEYLE